MLCLLLTLMRHQSLCDIVRLDDGGYYEADFSVSKRGRNHDNIMMRVDGVDRTECHMYCMQHLKCKTVNYNPKTKQCEMVDSDFDESNDVEESVGDWWNYGTPRNQDGGFSDWIYSECPVTCGLGQRLRYRRCNNPVPKYGGEDCEGVAHEMVDCETMKECVVHGGWSQWEAVGICTRFCGGGNQTMKRTCTDPEPKYGGNNCDGVPSQTLTCNNGPCPKGWKDVGCWNDRSSPRAIPTLEGTDVRLDGSTYRQRNDAINKCYQVARASGMVIFALQHGGWCAGTTNMDDYDKYGASNGCRGDGKGGHSANRVYKMDGAYSFFPVYSNMKRNQLIGTIPTLYENWKVSFEVYPTSFSNKHCLSILHMTTGGNVNVLGSRTPGIWTCRYDHLHVHSSVNGNHDYLAKPAKRLTRNIRHKIEVQQLTIKNDTVFLIRLNDKKVFSVINSQPMEFKNVEIYCSSPWHRVQPGNIRNLMIFTAPVIVSWSQWKSVTACDQPCGGGTQTQNRSCIYGPCDGVSTQIVSCNTAACPTDFSFYPEETDMVKDRLIETIPKLYKNWKVSLDVLPTSFINNGVHSNILHMTIDGDHGVYGERIPGIWFLGDKLSINSAVNGNPNLSLLKDGPDIRFPVNQWLHIEVEHKVLEGQYVYSVRLNNKDMDDVINNQPQVFDNVKVYVTEPWRQAQPGKVRNLVIKTTPSVV